MSNAPPPVTIPGSSAQIQTAAFADDDRIHFSTVTKTWRFEDDDGSELEYDAAKGVWVLVVDEDLLKSQQAAYSVSGVDEETPAAPVLARENKKRKEPDDYTYMRSNSDVGPSNKRGRSDKHASKDKTQSAAPPKGKNTAVFVTGLPLDTDFDELVERFAKCGVIEEDDDGEPKVKMYAREDGSFSGEALVVYFKEDSVRLAQNLLDDAEFRLGEASTVIRVQKAEFGHKNTTEHGETKTRRVVDKKKATRRIGKMQKKLAEWDDEDGFGPSIAPEDSAKDHIKDTRVVVLKHMFALKELEEDASLLLDLKEDVREECATLGDVTNVVLYDKEPEGVMTVKFRDPISAKACILKMDGRYFAGRRIEASLYTGKHRFRRSGGGDDGEGHGEEAEKKRLDNFAHWLMTQED